MRKNGTENRRGRCVGAIFADVCPVYECISTGKVVFKPQDQFGKESLAKYVEDAPNKRKILFGRRIDIRSYLQPRQNKLR
jgi:hypothetical protein